MTRTSPFPQATAPKSLKRSEYDTHHGIRREDEYAWLRAGNWQEVFKDPSRLDPLIREHLEAENAYQRALMADTDDLCKTLFAEMRGRIKEDDSSVPMKDGPFAYGSSFRKGGEQPRFFRTPREGGGHDIILDGDSEAEGKAYFRLGAASHSSDHRRLLWAYDDKGSEFFTIRVRDIETRRDLPDTIIDTVGTGAWSSNGDGFFYGSLDANHRPSKVYFHRIGTSNSSDRLIHDEADPGFFVNVDATSTRKWIFIEISDHETSEYRLLPADTPDTAPRIVAPRESGLKYDMEDGGDIFFILTNADGARDFKIVTAPANEPDRKNWIELVPHEPGRLILSFLSFKDYLVRLERKDGLPRIVVHERANGEEHMIAFDEEAYALSLSGSYEYDTDIMRFSYSSMTTPSQIFDYNMRSRQRVLLKTQEVPSGHNPHDFVTRRLMAPSHDGELVPISLIHHRKTALNGSAPCLLYGYGSYGMTIPAAFNTNCLSLVNRGFIYAIAHIRGGKDKGYSWYEDGKRDKKTNSFHDFIAAARHLVATNYTGHDRIIAQGGSAGGMLMGAVANMAPEAFGGIIAEVPFVDVLTTMLDPTLPLTPPEWPEWGNPIASREDYATIAAYSPYDNVGARDYPPILAVAGLTDPRVTYWEPAKWVARLRERKTGTNPVLFKINMDAGHAGASGRFSRLEEIAFTYAFALKVAGRQELLY